MKLLEEYPKEYEATFIGQEARKTVKIKDNISSVIAMNIHNDIKSMLTAMLELEMIKWDGKELKAALKHEKIKDLIDYAIQLIRNKEMDIKIDVL